MKVRIQFTVDVDRDAYAEEYSIDPQHVRDDVYSYAYGLVLNWLEEREIGGPHE